MHIVVPVASVRKLVRQSGIHYFTLPSRYLQLYGERVMITVVNPGARRWVTLVKRVGGSTIFTSVKIIVPKHVVRHLGLRDYVWVRVQRVSDKPAGAPRLLYISRPIDKRQTSVSVSARYMQVLTQGIDWDGAVSMGVYTPDGRPMYRAVTRLRVRRGAYADYSLPLPPLPEDAPEPLFVKLTPLPAERTAAGHRR